MNRRARERITLVLTLAVLVLIGLNSARYFVRLDLTSDRAYSISPVSRSIVSDLPEQLRVTYYLSDRLRARAPETGHLVDLLQEYSSYSRGRLSVQVVDPVAVGATSEAEALGVVPQQIQVVEQDQQSLATVYTGIVISYLNRNATLPVVYDPRTFEYELTSAIRNLVRGELPTIGVVLGRTEQALEREYQILTGRLERNFRLRRVAVGDPVPPEVDALFVIGGRDLSSHAIGNLDEYLVAGGRVLFALSGVDVDLEDAALTAERVQEGPLDDFLQHHGINVRRELVLDRFHQRIPIAQAVGRGTVQTSEPYPHWVSVVNYNSDHAITARFTGLDLYWPSPLDIGLSDDREIEILLESSAQSWLMGQPFVTDPTSPQALERDAAGTRGRYVLAAAVTGLFEPFSAETSVVTGSAGDSRIAGRIVVVGDADFLSNLLQYTGSGHNIDFAENIAGWLAMDDDLLAIRTRSTRDTRLNRIQDPVPRSRIGSFAATLNVFVVPAVIVAFGLIRGMKRRKAAVGRQRKGPPQ